MGTNDNQTLLSIINKTMKITISEKDILRRRLFKKILGSMIDTAYGQLSDYEVKDTCLGALQSFQKLTNTLKGERTKWKI